MKEKPFYIKRVVFGLLASALPFTTVTYAQDGEDDSIFDLSPFTIQEDEAVGYQALSTLAGTRIKTDLRDVGASIQVITEQFLEDTGATDGATLLSYGLNTEALGEHGNFGQKVGDGRVSSKQPHISAQRVRGLPGPGGAATLTRDFFITDMPFDSYNTTAVTINRGPNALLFGTGKAGGIINNATIQATTSQNFGEIKLRIGQNGSHRESLDYNAVLLQDRLAVRVALLNEEQQFHQRPAYQEDQRFFAAVTAVLFENENSEVFGQTLLRANIEAADLDGTPVKVLPPPDQMSDWWSVSRHAPYVAQIEAETGYDIPDYVDGSSDKDGTFISQFTHDNTGPSPCCGHGRGAALSAGGWGASLTFADMNSPDPTVADGSNVHGFFEYVAWNGWGHNYIHTYSDSIYRNGGDGPWRKGYGPNNTGVPTLNDRNVLDNTKVLLGGNLNRSTSTFDASNITLEQQLFNGKGGIEFAYDEQEYYNKSLFPYGDWFGIQIDVMEFLPNEQPNPNVGRPVMAAEIEKRQNTWNREANRVTAFYEFDFTEQEGALAWLGKQIFTGLWNQQEINFLDLDNRNRWGIADSNAPTTHTVRDIFGGGLISRSGDRAALLKYYLGPDLRGVSRFEDVRLTQYTSARIPGDNTDWLLGWRDAPGGDTDGPQIEYVPGMGDPLFYNNFKNRDITVQVGARNRQIIKTTALAWQSKWLDGHVVGLLGWRKDKSLSASQLDGAARDSEGFPLPAQYQLGPNDPEIEGDTGTASLVVHVPKNWTGDQVGISLHFNESESFEPVPSRRNIRGEILAPPNATTEEMGVTFEFLEGNLSLRLSDYEMVVFSTSNRGSSEIERLTGVLDGGLGNQQWANAMIQGVDFDEAYAQSARFGNTGNFSSYQDVFNALSSYLPDPLRGLSNPRFEPALPDSGATFTVNRIPNISTQSEVVSEGTEIELVGNLTSNWRVALNYGEQETVIDNSIPAALEVVLQAQQNLRSLNLYNLQHDPNPAMDSQNTIGDVFENWVLNPLLNFKARDGTISDEQRNSRINIITAYDFTEGTLKGWGVGGAYRWQGKVAAGYAKIRNPETDTIIDDVTRPFFGPAVWNADVWVNYTGKIPFILNDKVDWRIQLNIRNALGDDEYIPVHYHPTGVLSVVRNPNPMDVYLTNTFSF